MTGLADLLTEAGAIVGAMNSTVARQAGIADIQATYYDQVYGAVQGYLASSDRVTAYQNTMGQAVIEAFTKVFYAGYAEAGGEEVAPEDDDRLTELIDGEIENVKALFASLRELRATGDFDAAAVADARADGYSATLQAVFGEGKIRGAGNVMLTFDGPDGEESCQECRRYKGKRHGAKWWLKRDLVRRNGNENFTCGRWAPCQHGFYTDDGELYTD